MYKVYNNFQIDFFSKPVRWEMETNINIRRISSSPIEYQKADNARSLW